MNFFNSPERGGYEEPFDVDDYYEFAETDFEEAARIKAERQVAADEHEQSILDSPRLDYFEEHPPLRPKYDVGLYVADQGIPVPLINNLAEWQTAYDQGLAMLRSELAQDYDGLSGLLGSIVLNRESYLNVHITGLDYPSQIFREALDDSLNYGLRNLQIGPETFMKLMVWRPYSVTRELGRLNVNRDVEYSSVSPWRFVPGHNLKIFKDPTVDGRYHFGSVSERGTASGWAVDAEEVQSHAKPRKSDRWFDNVQLIEAYEAVRRLPRFDQFQAPLMEFQLDREGELHFLQYLRTGLEVEPVEGFDLPTTESTIECPYVRGATPPAGRDYRLYISPPQWRDRMRVGAIYIDWCEHNRLAHQIFSLRAQAIVTTGDLTLKDNHFDSAPLCRAKLALEVDFRNEAFDEWNQIARNDDRRLYYLDTHITANGRQGVIETDGQLKSEYLD